MADFSQLTDRQRQIYEFIRLKIETRGYGPTVREIGEELQHPFAQRGDVSFEGPGEKGSDCAAGRIRLGPSRWSTIGPRPRA